MTAAAVSQTATCPITTRRISFDDSLMSLSKYFAADEDLFMYHMTVGLSAVFPEGEDSFVRSVRHFRDQVSDPVLKRQVAGFIGQEATHGREHRALNARLDDLGYPSSRTEAITRRVLTRREKLMTPKANLAVTAALEHFTAVLAEVLLSDPQARRDLGDSVVTDVLLWHALEECVHKAVAFDVFQAVGGSERTRVRAMNFVFVSFLFGMMVQAFISMATDRRTWQRGNLWRSLMALHRSRFLNRRVIGRLRDYNRRGFHPDDRDTDPLLDEWRERLFGQTGTFNDRLAAA